MGSVFCSFQLFVHFESASPRVKWFHCCRFKVIHTKLWLWCSFFLNSGNSKKCQSNIWSLCVCDKPNHFKPKWWQEKRDLVTHDFVHLERPKTFNGIQHAHISHRIWSHVLSLNLIHRDNLLNAVALLQNTRMWQHWIPARCEWKLSHCLLLHGK